MFPYRSDVFHHNHIIIATIQCHTINEIMTSKQHNTQGESK